MPRQRFESIDILRGLVMVIMVLDHTRDFVHADALRFDPTDLAQTTPLLFLTRWVTHYCAPIFVFVAGMGSGLQLERGRAVPEVGHYLWTRGLWLVLLELTVVRFGVFFDFSLGFLGFLQVIWVLGVSMIVLAALIRLPTAAVVAIGAVMVTGHNLLDGARHAGAAQLDFEPVSGFGATIWSLLHQPGAIHPFGANGPVAFVMYPLVPWIGVMALGCAFGRAFARCDDRPRWLAKWGAGLTLAFVALRALNVYGDPSPWTSQGSLTFTLLSFLNTTKYPPSLLFLLMTMGPGLLTLALLEWRPVWPGSRVLLLFGQVPLFFYLLQWYVAHLLGVGAALLGGYPTGPLLASPPEALAPPPPGLGFGLGAVYLAWLLALGVLYYPCRWWAEQKTLRTDWWVRYL